MSKPNGLGHAEPGKTDSAEGVVRSGKPDMATIAMLRAIQIEISAGMVLFPMSPEEKAHNNACERAQKIVQNYREGFGLFQMTAGLKKKPSAPSSPSTTAPSVQPNAKDSHNAE